MLEIKFTGRGGQGAVVASQLLGLAFFKAGLYPQCYSVYGGERRGAPVAAFMRVDKERILLKCEIRTPNQLIFLDDSLLDQAQVAAGLPPKGLILINTALGPEAFHDLASFRLGLIDAAGIAAGSGLGRMINTAVLGAYARLAEQPDLDWLAKAVEEGVPAKVEANLAALRKAYQAISIPGGGR